jgi:hypothetical protein
LKIRLLFRILPCVHGMTNRARVSAVKSLGNRLAQRRMPRIINDHRRPCERLKSDPVQTNRTT